MVQSVTRFRVTSLEAWAPNVSTAQEWHAYLHAHAPAPVVQSAPPALRQMPPMLRRHASALARMTCDVAYGSLGDAIGVPMVFCSRFGEMDRAVDLMTSLATDGALSPTSFSLSVHNAIGGLFCIARRDAANCIALAGGSECAESGVLEACALLSDGAERVLLVVSEQPLPPVYAAFESDAARPFAWACLVEPAAGAGDFTLSCDASGDAAPGRGEEVVHDMAGPLVALSVLLGLHGDRERVANGRRWHWTRHA
jgi:hypothetical protein